MKGGIDMKTLYVELLSNMENISYTVVGFADAKKVATYHKDGLTKIGANRVANRLYRSGDFEQIGRAHV
mgnify:CR=1 FL=1